MPISTTAETNGSISVLPMSALPPSLVNWVIRYDDQWQMPKAIQGTFVGQHAAYAPGAILMIDDILSVDMKNKILTTDKGETYNLLGNGKRMIIMNEQDVMDEMMAMARERMKEEE